MIEPDDVAAVKAATDIVAIISSYMPLRRVGRRFTGLCPFHGEKTPSFSVNAELGVYHCFGCQRSGDAISYLQEKEQLDFAGAVEMLAARCGVTLRYTDQDEGESRRRRHRLVEALAGAVAWYHDRLLTAPDAAPARRYLRSRGFDGEQVRAFQLGWAPEGWDELIKALKLPRDVALDCGIALLNKRGNLQDFFRGRLLFPIFDPQGDPVSFGGRLLPGTTGPKYLNLGTTKIYDKSSTLYGLNWAKADAVQVGEVVVCEGYTDVIGFHTAGVRRAVATCGTALTEEHVKRLTRFARRVVLAFDADAAGQAAAERFHAWEQRYEIDVAVAALPAGVDPGELAQSDPEALRRSVTEATSFLSFRLARLWLSADLASAEGRVRAAERALAVISAHPNPLIREQYLQDVVGRTRVDLETLRQSTPAPRPAPRPTWPSRQTPASQASHTESDGAGGVRIVPNEPEEGSDRGEGSREALRERNRTRSAPAVRVGAESEALRLTVDQPEVAAAWFDPVLFSDSTHRAAVSAVLEHGSLETALQHVEPDVEALLRRAAVDESDATCEEVFVRLAQEAVRRELHRLNQERLVADDPLQLEAENSRLAELWNRLIEDAGPLDDKLEAGTALLTLLLNMAEERG